MNRSSVVNGQPHSGHPSCGKLTTGSSLCTATLVGKKTVVTAAHCVSPGWSHTFTVGGQAYKSASVHRHPKYNSYQLTYDIAVVMLQDAPSVQGAVINTTEPPVGTEITIVGYGKTGEWNSDAGVKRMAKSTIAELTPTRIRIPASNSSAAGNICNGDSGGPSYAMVNGQEVHVGVHSTKSGSCGSGGHDTRVDTFADWISQTTSGDVNKPGAPPPGGGGGGTAPPPSDTQPPQVAITYPLAGAKVPPSISVTAKITDDKGVTKVELLVDGKVVSTNGGATSFPVVLQPGSRTLQVNAHDAAGNKGQATVSVTVEGTPPPNNPPNNPPNTPPPPEPEPGLFGTTCQEGSDCQSGMCANDETLSSKYCTQLCGPDLPCPNEAICFDAVGGTQQVCGLGSGQTPTPPGSGGNALGEEALLGSCSVNSSSPLSATWLLILLALLPLRRFWR